jgi:hypothetical protein
LIAKIHIMKTICLSVLGLLTMGRMNAQLPVDSIKTLTAEGYKEYFMSDIQDVRLGVNKGNNNDMVCILPSHEADKALQKEMNDYYFTNFINGLHFNHSGQKCRVVTDEEALRMDLSNTNIRTFGTIKGNLWTAWFLSNVKDFPIKIFNDRIVADTVYNGSNYVVTAVWYNPYNAKYGVILNIAQSSNCYQFPVGREVMQYHIFQNGKKVSKSCYYHLVNNRWVSSAKRDPLLKYKIAIGNQRMNEMREERGKTSHE